MKILIADDHPLFRDALGLLAQRLAEQVDIQFAQDYQSLLKMAGEEGPWDLLLVDFDMPGMAPAEGLARLCASQATTPVVVITSAEGGKEAQTARDAGARAYLSKAMDSRLMLNALQLILDGGLSIHPDSASGPRTGKPSDDSGFLERLTPRQIEVLEHLCRGEPNKRIASHLSLSVSTVKQHIHSILREMGAANRTEAVVIARPLLSRGDGS